MAKAQQAGINLRAHPTPYDSVALFMTPKMSGYSALSIEDLTAVEFRSRDIMRDGLAWFRNYVPGFERAWILDSASQIGTRHARRLAGVEQVTLEHWRNDGAYDDSIGLCPGLTPDFPTLGIPYRSLVPARMDGMLAAGRNSSCDTRAHAALREVPECWVMGEAAGLAAAMAVRDGIQPRDVVVAALQASLEKQGAIVHRRPDGGPKTKGDAYEDFKGSIHFSTPGLEPAKGSEDRSRIQVVGNEEVLPGR